MRSLVIFLLSVTIAGCAGLGQPDTRPQQFHVYLEQLTRLRDSGQISSYERAVRMRDAAVQLWGPPGAYDQEFWAYVVYIATERDKGMSKAQADYLISQKQNEIRARMQADYVRQMQIQEAQQQLQQRRRQESQPSALNPMLCSIHEVSGGMGYGMCFR